jgi:hypothetical protein
MENTPGGFRGTSGSEAEVIPFGALPDLRLPHLRHTSTVSPLLIENRGEGFGVRAAKGKLRSQNAADFKPQTYPDFNCVSSPTGTTV